MLRLFKILLLLLLFSNSNGAVNMLLFWGYPTSDTKYCTFENSDDVGDTFVDCINMCLGSATCMLAYGNDKSCGLCDTYAVSSITQSDVTTGIQVAVKVDPLLGCPVDIKANTYQRTDTSDGYSLSFSDPTWSISYFKSCLDASWRTFMRPAGGMCIKVFLMGTGLNRTDSETLCDEFGDNYGLSGLQNVIERSYIYETAKPMIGRREDKDFSSIWLNGNMRTDCYPLPTPSGCDGINAFENFPYQNNFDAYNFPAGFPNFTKQWPDLEYYNACLQLNVAQNKANWDGMVTNSICNYSCNGGTAICAAAYACQGPAV